MNEREKFMYSIINALSILNAPIVFKGALVLKAIQSNTGNKSGILRETHDIDGDWVGQSPSMEYLVNLLQQALNIAGYTSYEVVITREYSDGKSAGFNFINTINDFEIASMDLSIRKNDYSTDIASLDGFYFKGQLITRTLADKICVASSNRIFRRIKDLIDIYIISYIYNDSYNEIVDVMNKSNRLLGDCNALLNEKEKLIHAYSKYKNTASELPFDVIYNRCLLFLNPFIKYKGEIIIEDLKWDDEKGWL